MFDSLLSIAAVRDWVIVVYCLLGIVLFAFGAIFVAVLIWIALSIKAAVKDIINDSVKPTMKSIRETAETIKGTTDFMGEKAATPVIKTYGMVTGVRRGLSVLSGLSKFRRG